MTAQSELTAAVLEFKDASELTNVKCTASSGELAFLADRDSAGDGRKKVVLSNIEQPSADSHAATKKYVDDKVQGLNVREAVKYSSQGNIENLTTAVITLSDIDGSTDLSGETLAAGDRVLVRNQSVGAENGIYVAVEHTNGGGALALARSVDLAIGDAASSVFMFVSEGTDADTSFVCTTDSGADTVDTHPLTFATFAAIGSSLAGDELTITKSGGGVFSVLTQASVRPNKMAVA